MKKAINTDKAPAAIGPYSQATVAGGMMYVSGQLGIDPATGKFVEGCVACQSKQVFKNLVAVLAAEGLTLDNVVKTTVYLKDMNDFVKMNDVYAQFFTEPYPARAAIEIARLPKDGLVEIECIASVE